MSIVEYMAVVGFAGLFFSIGYTVGKIVERLYNNTKK